MWHRYPVDAVVASGTGPAAATDVPTVDDIGSTFYVVATASRPGYADNTQTSTASTTVHLGSFVGVERPTVTGTGVVGSPFTATLDVTGTTPAPAPVDFQWYRTDGTPVAGATSATFTSGLDLLGELLYVVATLRAPGHHDYVTLGSDYTRTVSLASFGAGNGRRDALGRLVGCRVPGGAAVPSTAHDEGPAPHRCGAGPSAAEDGGFEPPRA